MSQGFLQSLDLKGDIFEPEGLLVAYQNGNIDASFVLHYLLGDFIKRFGKQGRILLILSNETTNHWTSVASKLGWNLNSLKDKGQLGVIDLGEALFQTLIHPKSADNMESDGRTSDGVIDLETLYLNCKEELGKLCPKPNAGGGEDEKLKVLVVVEDLTTLLFNIASPSRKTTAVAPERQVLTFLKKLLQMNVGPAGLATVSVATLVNSCGSYFSSAVSKVLATVAFEVSPLQTGYSELFSGYLLAKQRPGSCTREPLVKSCQYKLDDRQIKFSPLTKFNF